MKKPVVDEELCTGCDICVGECPNDALELASDVAKLVKPDDCDGCESCAEECPSEAITMKEG